MDVWKFIHAERESLYADLEGLSEEQWATPSLCAGWTVRDVLAHITATAEITPGKFFSKFIGAGFNFNKMTAKDVATYRGSSGEEALAKFKAAMASSTHPPGPINAMVGEAVVHSQDMRRPLGIAHEFSPDGVEAAARFFASSNALIGGKRRATGLTFRAEDQGWSMGSGPEVSGPAASIALSIAGRKDGLTDLSGEGLTTLSGRF